jgi:hypothetical protein
MNDIINFSKFFQNKKELPAFNKEEILNNFFIEDEEDQIVESEESVNNTMISNFPHIAKEESDKRSKRIEKSYEEDPDGMYPRDDSRYDNDQDSGGWQDGMGEPPSNESVDRDDVVQREDIEKLIQQEVEKIRKQTIEDYKIQENILINEEQEVEEEIVEKVNTDEYYPVFIDKSENFTCDIELEGAKLKDTQVRLVLETENWNLLFNGEIDRNGKVNIPIKKLSLFEEGDHGSIKMEVIAEGTVFIPWEQEFEAKRSKKVMVSFNENKKSKPLINTGVKVSVRK